MFTFSTAQLVSLLLTYRYLIIFPIAFVEGPILAVICGWLISAGVLNFFLVYLILILADLLGDAVHYVIGYWGGPPLIRRWGKWLHLDLDQIEKMKNHFDHHGGKILLTVKVVPNLATAPILIGAGLAKYNFFLFLRYSLVIEVFKTFVLILVGYFIGDAYQKIVVYFDILGFISSLSIAIAILGFIIYLYRKKKNLAYYLK